MLNNKTILITGGTGSFDKDEIEAFCKEQENVKVVVLRE